MDKSEISKSPNRSFLKDSALGANQNLNIMEMLKKCLDQQQDGRDKRKGMINQKELLDRMKKIESQNLYIIEMMNALKMMIDSDYADNNNPSPKRNQSRAVFESIRNSAIASMFQGGGADPFESPLLQMKKVRAAFKSKTLNVPNQSNNNFFLKVKPVKNSKVSIFKRMTTPLDEGLGVRDPNNKEESDFISEDESGPDGPVGGLAGKVGGTKMRTMQALNSKSAKIAKKKLVVSKWKRGDKEKNNRDGNENDSSDDDDDNSPGRGVSPGEMPTQRSDSKNTSGGGKFGSRNYLKQKGKIILKKESAK